MLDGDMFLVKPFSIRRFMKDYDIAGFPQNRSNKVCYLFPGLVFLNMASLPNKETMDWSGGYINGDHLDTGGQMHHYLKNNPNIRLFHMNQIHLGRRDKIIENVCQKCDKINNLACTHNTKILSSFGLDKHGIKFLQSGPEGGCEFFLDGNFFHYRAASWSFSIDHNKKTLLVSKYMNDILNSK